MYHYPSTTRQQYRTETLAAAAGSLSAQPTSPRGAGSPSRGEAGWEGDGDEPGGRKLAGCALEQPQEPAPAASKDRG